MSNIESATGPAPAAARKAGIRGPKTNLPKIVVDGDEWGPRNDFAVEIGVHPKTVERMNYPTVSVGGVN